MINEEASSPYDVQEFQHNPGIYFEKIGKLHHAKETWKLVVKLDLTSLTTRYNQIMQYLKKAKIMCAESQTQTCGNIGLITQREEQYLQNMMTQIRTIYKPPTNRRRGLIDGIGSLAKSLFGTMDAKDEKLIKEQLDLLQNKQQTIQHAIQNQLMVLNTTITHVGDAENIIERNEKLLQDKMMKYLTREELNEQSITHIAILSDLIRDAENIIEYLTYIRQGAMHPKLMPIDNIIHQLKEATQQIPQGLYFPFKVHREDWLDIERHTQITAFSDKTTIYTILRFPLIAQPNYDLINVIALPVHDYSNIFTTREIENEIIAVDREKLTYLKMTKRELEKCVRDDTQYMCRNSMPTYRVNTNAPCEVQMYTQQRNYHHCPRKHIVTNNGFWITLDHPYSWLYSFAADLQITIECDGRHEQKLTVRNTGKISLKNKCKLTTRDMIVQSKEIIFETNIETYLPELNITLLRDQKIITNDNNTLQSLSSHGIKLNRLQAKLEEINSSIEEKNQNFFSQKQFIYPMTSSGIITIIIIILIVYIISQRKNRRKDARRPIFTIDSEPSEYPKSILKRSKSLRY